MSSLPNRDDSADLGRSRGFSLCAGGVGVLINEILHGHIVRFFICIILLKYNCVKEA